MKTNTNKLFVLLIHLLVATTIQAQTHNWTRTNPGGGGAYSTIGASVTGIVIAGSDLSGAYRSRDGGSTWDVIGASNGLSETHISGVGFDRTDGDILYMGTENGIFRSVNGGNTVNQVLTGGYITDIEFGTNDTNIGYAAYHPTFDSNNGKIYKSNDRGVNWTQISMNLPSGIRILKIVVNPNDADSVYILTGQGRFACGPADVYRSTNGGENWENITATLPEILDVAIDPKAPQNIFITTMNADCLEPFYWTDLDGSLYKSTDTGTSWGTPLSTNTGVIWIDTDTPVTIRLIDPRESYPWINTSGTFTSTNGGATFSKTGDVDNWDTFFNKEHLHSYGSSFNGISKTLGEDLSNKNNYYWINSQWVYKTTDNGSTFTNIFTEELSPGYWKSRGFDNVNMMDISISKANSNLIYLGYFDIGIWKSLDQGESWQSCNPSQYSGDWDGKGGNCATILADPSRENVVWASMSGNQNGEIETYLLKSSSTGDKNSWILSDNGLPKEEIMGLSIDANSNETSRTLYLTALGDVYKSVDDGVNWNVVFDCNGCRFTAVDKINGSIVYAGGEAGAWRSTDGGTSWVDISHPEMKAGTGIRFWDENYDGIFDIKTDPNNTNWVYATALGTGKGLYKSVDNGTTWTKLIVDDFMRKTAISPENSNILYATSSSAFEAGGYDSNSTGIHFSDDGGQNWSQQNQGMAYPLALSVAINNEMNATVFVGSPGTGFQKSAVPDSTVDDNDNLPASTILYPSPTAIDSRKFTVEALEIYKILIFDAIGQKVFSKTYPNTNSVQINLKIVAQGTYFVKVKTAKGTTTKRIIIL